MKVGETVYPGQAIAESSAPHEETLHHVKIIQSHWEMGEMGMEWINFPVNIFQIRSKLKVIKPSPILNPFIPWKSLLRKWTKKN